MKSTFWMTAQEAEDEIKRREALTERIKSYPDCWDGIHHSVVSTDDGSNGHRGMIDNQG